jgi:hypothetical protein
MTIDDIRFEYVVIVNCIPFHSMVIHPIELKVIDSIPKGLQKYMQGKFRVIRSGCS